MQLIDAKTFIKLLGISPRTLLYWEKAGKITPLRTPSGGKRYTEANYRQALGLPEPKKGER